MDAAPNTAIPHTGEFLGVAGVNDGWAPLASLEPAVREPLTAAFREHGPRGFRDIDGLGCRSLAFAPGALLVRVVPAGPRHGFGLYGVWNGAAWRTLDEKSTRKLDTLLDLNPQVSTGAAALDLVMFFGLFSRWDTPPARVLVTPRDLAVTRPPNGYLPRGGVPRAYDSLQPGELEELCAPRTWLDESGNWHVRAHAQILGNVFLAEMEVRADFTAEPLYEEHVLDVLPVDEVLQSRTPPSVGEIMVAEHVDSIRKAMPKRVVPRPLRELVGVGRYILDMLFAVVVGLPLLVAWIVFRRVLALALAPALIVAGRPEDSYEKLPARLRTTRRRRLATCCAWGAAVTGTLALGGTRAALGAAAVLGATFVLASAAFVWNEADRYALGRRNKHDDGLLARLPDTAAEYALLTAISLAILPLALFRVGMAFPGVLPGLGLTVRSAYAFTATAVLLGSPPVALLRDLGFDLPLAQATGAAGKLAGRLGLAVNTVVFAWLVERLFMRRRLRKEALARLEKGEVDVAVALGMRASQPLRKLMEHSRRDDVRRRAALSLALIGDRGSLALMERLRATEGDTPLGRTLAVTAALMGRDELPAPASDAVLEAREVRTNDKVDLWGATIALLDPDARAERVGDLRRLLAVPNASLDLKWWAATAIAQVPGACTLDDVLEWTPVFVSDEWYAGPTRPLSGLAELADRHDRWVVFDRLASAMMGHGPPDPVRAMRLFNAWIGHRLRQHGDDGTATLAMIELQRFVQREGKRYELLTNWEKVRILGDALRYVVAIFFAFMGILVHQISARRPRSRVAVAR